MKEELQLWERGSVVDLVSFTVNPGKSVNFEEGPGSEEAVVPFLPGNR